MPQIPDEPESEDSLAGEETVLSRYEDVTQDGRLRLEGVWPPVGRLLWTTGTLSRVLHRLRVENAITNVLANLSMEATDVRILPRSTLRHVLRYRFEQTVGEGDEVNRILFTTWLRTESMIGGSRALVARAYGQRVLTRLEAGEHQRVTDLPDIGLSSLELPRTSWTPADEVLELPASATALEPAPRVDPSRVVFGLSHTDLNQHVNFLVYPRIFEQAALGRFVDLGLSAKVMARRIEVVYRKPSFAGEVLFVAGQAFRQDDRLGVVTALVEGASREGSTGGGFSAFGRPRCVARMWFA